MITALGTKMTSRKNSRIIWTLSGTFEKDRTPQRVPIRSSPFRIGRRPDHELSLSSPVISGTHAELIEVAGVLCIRDSNSTNGTFVNGKRIKEDTLLSEGDWIEIGDVHLRVGSVKEDGPREALGFQKTRLLNLGKEKESHRGLIQLLEQRSLEPCFQPIHRLSDRNICGYEYLARSNVSGVTGPAAMFSAAEAAGQEVELSMMCREVGTQHSTCLPPGMPLFLNTHPAEPLLEQVVPQLRQLRGAFPMRPLVLEIHEGAITEPGLVRNVRAALHEIDVQLAFDDFGAGQARIRELICAPSDYIKFDAALIHDLQDVSKEQFRLFRSIIQGVREEGAITVAEGVETPQMIELCEQTGFDLVQGYALSRPAIMQAIPDSETGNPTQLLKSQQLMSRQIQRAEST